MTARFKDHILGPDTHTNRPAASGVPEAAIYECTTHGLIYKNIAGTWVTFGVLVPPGGTTGQALVKNSGTDGDVGWGAGGGGGSPTFAAAAGARTTTQSIPNGTYTAVLLNGTEDYDTNSIHDPATNPSRFTIPAGMSGKWRFSANVEFAGSTSGQRVVGWAKNGTLLGNRYIDCRPTLTTAAYGPVISTSSDIPLVATDYIEAQVFQDSGGALNVVSARVTCQYLG